MDNANDFNELKRLAWHYSRFLYSTKHRVGYISRYDYGHDLDGFPRRAYKKETLLALYKGQLIRLRKITKKQIFEHVARQHNYYYTSDSRSPYAMIGFDQDAHHGEPDILDAVQFAMELMCPEVYLEVSTNNRGYHWYVFLDKEGRDNQANVRLRKVCKRLEAALRDILENNKFEAKNIEVKGYCSCWTDKGYIHAPLIKLPRLAGGMADLEKLGNGQMMTVSALEKIVKTIEVRANEDQEQKKEEIAVNATEGRCLYEMGENDEDSEKVEEKSKERCGKRRSNTHPVSYMGHTNPLTRSPDHSDSRIRKLWAVTEFCNRRNRKAIPDDLEAIYRIYIQECKLGDNTETERKKRILQAIEISDWQPLNDPYVFSPGKYLPIVKQLRIPSFEFTWNKRNKIDETRLADFVAIKVQDAFLPGKSAKYDGRASRDATIQNSRVLKSKGLMTWIITPDIYTKFLKMSTAYGLLHIYDEYVPPQRDSKGRRITLNGSQKHKGIARLIGPGKALAKEYGAFQTIWQRIMGARRRVA